jgi:hypothetical protein
VETADTAAKLPPPFPVVAPPTTGKTTPPIPHISAAVEPDVQAAPPAFVPKRKRPSKIVYVGAGLAALLVLGGGGYFVWENYLSPPPPPPPVVAKPKPKPIAPAAATSAATAPAKPAAATPAPSSPVANKPAEASTGLAHVPVNAINKAQAAVDARRDGEQVRAGSISAGADLANRPAATAPTAGGASKPAPKPVAAASVLAPGVSATNSEVEAVPDANAAFRAFVANGKITGVIGGVPPKVLFNGRMMRAGDIVDPQLGITFDSIDPERKLIIFKDKSGATVTRKY